MSSYPEPFNDLVDALRELPGVGRRTAERMALAMLKWPGENLLRFGEVVKTVSEGVGSCPECGNMALTGEYCGICVESGRNRALVCVVEDAAQLAVIERSGAYRGLYHVLGGRISPLDDRGEADLNIESLTRRIASGEIKELVIALGADVESRATGFMLAEKYAGSGVKVTMLAQGIPAGGNLVYADSATISMALSNRRDIKD